MLSDKVDQFRDCINDPVNNPSHYTQGSVECITAIEASMSHEAFCGFLKGNVMKYMWRYENKGKAIEDLKKADWYVRRLIATKLNYKNQEKIE